MASREAILANLRRHIPGSGGASREAAVAARLSAHQRGVMPDFPASRVKLLNRFIAKAEAAQASVEQVSAADMAKAVSAWLRTHNLPQSIRIGEDARLNPLRRHGSKLMTISMGRSDGDDLAAVSHAEAGIAETGTLALLSGKENPTTLNFLPENHIVVVNTADIVAHYEDLWDRIRDRKSGAMPRTVNLVTGPSRSADIEQTLILGAHGPVRLHILIVRK